MRRLLTGIAIAALTVSTAYAKPGGGGGGHGNGSEAHGNGGGPGNGGDHGNGGDAHGNDGGMAMGGPGGGPGNDHRGGGNDRGPPTDRGQGNERHGDRAVAPALDPGRADFRGNGNGNRHDEARVVRDLAPGPVRSAAIAERVVWTDFDRRGAGQGCPPGLAKKNNGCMPPGLARQQNDWRAEPDWWGLRGLSDLGGYRYYDGNMVRLGSDGRIAGYYPLLGGALAAGNPWPDYYPATPLPAYYQSYYGLGDDYRYADGAIYRLDPQSQAIQSIAALLTGDRFSVGQPLPEGYGAYNVPYSYRDRYADNPDATYRYSDGYVYQVDPTSQLIVAAIRLLT